MGLQIVRLIKAVFQAIGIIFIAAVCGFMASTAFQVLLEYPLILLGVFVVGCFSVLVYLLY